MENITFTVEMIHEVDIALLRDLHFFITATIFAENSTFISFFGPLQV